MEPTDLDVFVLLSEGAESMANAGAAAAVALLMAVGVGLQIAVDSIVLNGYQFFLSEIRSTDGIENRQEVIDQITTVIDQWTASTITLDASTSALFGLIALLFVIGEVGSIIAIRAFAADSPQEFSLNVATRRLGIATLHGLIIGFLLSIVVVLGLGVLVITGIFIFVGTVFVRQAIALDDKGPFEAVSEAWGLAKGNRLLLAGFVIGLFIFGTILSTLVSTVVPAGEAASVVGAAIATLVTVYSMAVFTEMYQRLRRRQQATGQDQSSDEWAKDDEWT